MKNLIIIISLFILISLNCRTSNDNPVSGNPTPSINEVKVYNPSVGEKWNPGRKYQIQWSGLSSDQKVNVILLKKKQYYRLIIGSNITNNGRLDWKIPEDIPQSVSYQIKIENSENPAQFFYSEVFEISN